LKIEETMSATQIQNDDKAVALTRYAWLSISVALTTIVLKTIAYLLTGSVGLLSDAMESIVNLIGAVIALSMLIIAARPPDDSHMYGHSKAEYFASSAEGILILIAAGGILWTAIERLISPRPLQELGAGLVVSIAASLVNLVAARILIATGKKRNSITLEADGHHLMTDVWTSVVVIGGIAIVAVTNWFILDPILAILVALNIIWTGVKLLQRSVAGFMDASLPANEQQLVEKVIAKYKECGVQFHAIRTRQSAARRFISVHMLMPGVWTLHDAHHIAEDFEGDVRSQLKDAIVQTHLEPIDDEISVIDAYDK
jgi:cation diffusion facilitator family transporter